MSKYIPPTEAPPGCEDPEAYLAWRPPGADKGNGWSLKDYVNNDAGWKFWTIFVTTLAVIGGVAILAIGPTSSYRPSPSSSPQRAWLSPNLDGDSCKWMPGNASDYGYPYSFCNYSAP